jgi:SAM-dependent methyltransferase
VGDEGRARTRWSDEAHGRAGTYDDRWAELATQGRNIHGEADFVQSICVRAGSRLGGVSVLDAGCGTGRVAVELAARGFDVEGVDLDASMLERARAKAPGIRWVQGDLLTVELGRTFDVVVLAGNVMIFLAPGTEAGVVANMARHLSPGGALVAGFQLQPGGLDLGSYDRHAADAGLDLTERWATWDREPYDGGDYAVSVHHRKEASGSTLST